MERWTCAVLCCSGDDCDASSQPPGRMCCSADIVRRGGLILFCDYVVSLHARTQFTRLKVRWIRVPLTRRIYFETCRRNKGVVSVREPERRGAHDVGHHQPRGRPDRVVARAARPGLHQVSRSHALQSCREPEMYLIVTAHAFVFFICSAIHRNSAASGLFIQAINSRCENLNHVSFLALLSHVSSLPLHAG